MTQIKEKTKETDEERDYYSFVLDINVLKGEGVGKALFVELLITFSPAV